MPLLRWFLAVSFIVASLPNSLLAAGIFKSIDKRSGSAIVQNKATVEQIRQNCVKQNRKNVIQREINEEYDLDDYVIYLCNSKLRAKGFSLGAPSPRHVTNPARSIVRAAQAARPSATYVGSNASSLTQIEGSRSPVEGSATIGLSPVSTAPADNQASSATLATSAETAQNIVIPASSRAASPLNLEVAPFAVTPTFRVAMSSGDNDVKTKQDTRQRGSPQRLVRMARLSFCEFGTDELCAQVRKKLATLPQGSAYISGPNEVSLGQKFRLELSVDPSKIIDLLALRERNPQAETTKKAIKWSPTMSASLDAGPNFKAMPEFDPARATNVTEGQETIWSWTVEAVEGGENVPPLTVKLWAHVSGPDGQKSQFALPVLTHKVNVKVTLWQGLSKGIQEVEPISAFMVALLTALAGAFGWIINRKWRPERVAVAPALPAPVYPKRRAPPSKPVKPLPRSA